MGAVRGGVQGEKKKRADQAFCSICYVLSTFLTGRAEIPHVQSASQATRLMESYEINKNAISSSGEDKKEMAQQLSRSPSPTLSG